MHRIRRAVPLAALFLGGPNAFYQVIGFGPTAVSTEPVPVLTVCSS